MSATPQEYTIDEISAASGVPSRTIRFYQAEGVLPSPRKQGRVALYGPHHLERLQLISTLQDRGLRLRAIRDVLKRSDSSGDTIEEWLGVSARMEGFVEDKPQTMSVSELTQFLGETPQIDLGELEAAGLVEVLEPDSNLHYRIPSPGLLRVALALGRAGIHLQVAVGLRQILEKRLARAADELVSYAIQHIGQGFGHSDAPQDITAAVDALMPNAAGGDAVQLIFAREVSRAASERLHEGFRVVTQRQSTKQHSTAKPHEPGT